MKESMAICLEFSTLKSFENFPNVSSLNGLFFSGGSKRLGNYQNFSVC